MSKRTAFANDLINFRKKNGYTQETLAQLCGLSSGSIARFETGYAPSRKIWSVMCADIPGLVEAVAPPKEFASKEPAAYGPGSQATRKPSAPSGDVGLRSIAVTHGISTKTVLRYLRDLGMGGSENSMVDKDTAALLSSTITSAQTNSTIKRKENKDGFKLPKPNGASKRTRTTPKDVMPSMIILPPVHGVADLTMALSGMASVKNAIVSLQAQLAKIVADAGELDAQFQEARRQANAALKDVISTIQIE